MVWGVESAKGEQGLGQARPGLGGRGRPVIEGGAIPGGWKGARVRDLVVRAGQQRLLIGAMALVVGLTVSGAAAAQGRNGRYAAFVQDAATGQVLVAEDADARRYPASLTKMMTLYMAFEALERGTVREDTEIVVSRHAASRPPSKLGLEVGSTITVRQAMLALVTKSANDAAAALGEHLGGGSEAAFARMMTRKAKALGMGRTNFRNASGLPDPAQYTTARDMAMLGRRLVRDFPSRYGYFSTPGFEFEGSWVGNHNRLLRGYPGADGIKTGYIDASGFNLVASAVRGKRRLVAVMFGGSSGTSRDTHVMRLLDRGFASPMGRPEVERRPGQRMAGRAVQEAMAEPVPRVLRPVVAAVPVRPRPVMGERTGGSWAVQVGAYSSRRQARDAAERAARRGGMAAVMPVRTRRGELWRARVVGLQPEAAQGLCRALRGSCMVLTEANQ